MIYRTCYLNSLRDSDEGKKVILSGWVDSMRDHGGLIFIDLRDREGITQIVFHPQSDDYDKVQKIKSEYVIRIEGIVKKRSDENINSDIDTGRIEVECNKVEVLNKSLPLPFDIKDENVNETIRLKYRYLDLRNKKRFEKLKKRSTLMKHIREYLDSKDFIEMDTPILTKATPEGARDYLVPSRLNQGEFYALPQSPQLFKQMFMVAGFDKYYQIARCFRDEDLRSDRQPEFTQLDIEQSFVSEQDIMDMAEGLVEYVLGKTFNKTIGYKIPTITYDDAMNFYGTDAPDTRFDMKLVDLSNELKGCGFSVFNSVIEKGGLVKAINAKNSCDKISRKDIDDLTKSISIYGAKGLAWIKVMEDGSLSSVIAKFFNEDELNRIKEKVNAQPNDTIFFVADIPDVVNSSLAFLRLELAKKLNLINSNDLNFVWVVDFPMFEFGEGKYKAVHHPFTSSKEKLNDENFTKALSRTYDLVLNGCEIAGGSIRISDPEDQLKSFKIVGIEKDEAEQKFTHIMNALRYGAPPHGGIAFGFDRFLAIMTGSESLRDIIAFPKTQKGACPVTGAPTTVDNRDLVELRIEIKKDK